MKDVIAWKRETRKRMLQQRDALKSKEKRAYDEKVCAFLSNLVDELNVQTIHCYLPMGSEINVLPFITEMLDMDKTIVCPKTLPKPHLENRVLTSLNELEKGVFGTVHPTGPVYSGHFDLIVMPGLAFDDSRNRLGYGGAYYDNFIIHHPKAFKQATAYPFQLIDEVMTEDHDKKVSDVYVN